MCFEACRMKTACSAYLKGGSQGHKWSHRHRKILQGLFVGHTDMLSLLGRICGEDADRQSWDLNCLVLSLKCISLDFVASFATAARLPLTTSDPRLTRMTNASSPSHTMHSLPSPPEKSYATFWQPSGSCHPLMLQCPFSWGSLTTAHSEIQPATPITQ